MHCALEVREMNELNQWLKKNMYLLFIHMTSTITFFDGTQ